LVYPTQRLEARKAILEALEEHVNLETGIGYNLLFEKVKDKIGSRATFEKYLSKLQREGYVTKQEDPHHKRAVILYRLSEASDFELLTLHLSDKLSKAFKRKEVKPILYDEKELGKIGYTSKKNVEIVLNCVFLSYRTLIKMLPKIEETQGITPFVRTVEVNRKIKLDMKAAD